MSIRSPIYNGVLQSDLDVAGFDLLNYGGSEESAPVRKFDVKAYGALGDGLTDDTIAIEAALAAIPMTGGVLYFPAGQYMYSGSTLTLNRQITVEGDGGLVEFGNTPAIMAVSTIDFDSSTNSLFSVMVSGCSFRNIYLRNISGSPSAGAGITVIGTGSEVDSWAGSRTTYEDMTVDGFYIGIDVQAGTGHRWANCSILGSVVYGIKLRNVSLPDGGDHSITDCWIYNYIPGRNPISAIRIESGGGVKIINTKINGFPMWVNGIDLAVAAGAFTVDLLVCNCSIENFTGVGIKGRNTPPSFWGWTLITGNEFLGRDSVATAIDFAGDAPVDFDGLVITGNFGTNPEGSATMIALANVSHVTMSGNAQYGFTNLVTLGSGVTFADTPIYIGRDARLVSVTGGAKLQVRNPGTDTWADGDQWTNP